MRRGSIPSAMRRAGPDRALAGRAHLEREAAVGAPDQAVGAERLDELDREAVPVAGAIERDVLRPDAERDRPVGLGRDAELVAVERQTALAGDEGGPVAGLLEPAFDEIHPRRADEAGDEPVGRAVVDVERAAELLDALVLHHRDPVGERHRLDLVVGDVDHRGRAEPLVQALDLVAQLVPELGVEVGQRLVEQEHGGVAHQRPADRDALALAARELVGPALEQLARSAAAPPPGRPGARSRPWASSPS